jgi:serine kinase of HPr protein (carbohydrate metabolism regulator)
MDRGALLVGDDYLVPDVRDSALWVRPAPRLAGMIEVRNLGLCTAQYLAEARIALVVRLDGTPQRLPVDEIEIVQGIGLPRLILNAYEASAPIKVDWALQHRRSSV